MADLDFAGTWTALVTPFADGGRRVDFEALDRLVEAQISGGVAGLVPCGTTGEAPTLGPDEQREVIARVVKAARGRVPVVAGTGSNATDKTVAASRAALKAGADGVMLVMPYYNKPSQDGLCEHVLVVARAVSCPVVLYNIPGRSVVDLGVAATVRICEQAKNVAALKDATGNVLRCQELSRALGDRLAILCGDDALTVAMMAVGARGVISVTSNVAPALASEVTRGALSGSFGAAKNAHFRLLGLHGLLFAEPNPAPAKCALSLLGACAAEVRLPMVEASDALRARIAEELGRLGLLRA